MRRDRCLAHVRARHGERTAASRNSRNKAWQLLPLCCRETMYSRAASSLSSISLRPAMKADASKAAKPPEKPLPRPHPWVDPGGHTGTASDAGARRLPRGHLVDYQDNPSSRSCRGQCWMPIWGQVPTPIAIRPYCRGAIRRPTLFSPSRSKYQISAAHIAPE